MEGAVDRQLRAAQNGAVAPDGTQVGVDLPEFLAGAGLPFLDLIVDDGHDRLLQLLRQGHGGQPGGGQFVLVDARLHRTVRGQDAHGLLAHGLDRLDRLPDHVDDGDVQLGLEPVGKVVGRVAGDGQDRTPRPLQQLRVGQQMGKHRLCLLWGA